MPIHYNHLVQAAIYNSIDSEMAKFLHERGFQDGKRSFKMFSFSLLQGNFEMDKENKVITFDNSLKLTISSPIEDFCQSLVNILLTKGTMRLENQDIEIDNVYAHKMLVQKDEVIVKTLSPAVLYSTLLRADGRKYTAYFQPGEADFNKLLSENLQRKYRALFGMDPPEGQVLAKPLGLQKMRIINYKNTVIKGYSGKMILKGPIPLLQLAVDGGLGSKNSQGFGCLGVVSENRNNIY